MMNNSNFFIEIESVTFLKEYEKKLSEIYINIILGDEVKKSKELTGTNFNERFEL